MYWLQKRGIEPEPALVKRIFGARQGDATTC